MEYNCHFVTTSNVASPLELAEPVVSQLNQLSSEGAFAFDATLKEEVMFMCIPLAFLADSPMAAKFTNTPNPGKANNPCPPNAFKHVSEMIEKHEILDWKVFIGASLTKLTQLGFKWGPAQLILAGVSKATESYRPKTTGSTDKRQPPLQKHLNRPRLKHAASTKGPQNAQASRSHPIRIPGP
ncbi:hypothetical protein PGTUg99_017274 [Puccinia graminis f. sp. tritici]|uniref:Uncharacterized protein n=1 Tax=Puccinia graminis f. sp. tritici TaxID=56615 RepID=A0A5B0R4Y8_PUCGR|nr:hypothetical protein PGTUg99_017274 [Puccinia graminis f. sp. tritici]